MRIASIEEAVEDIKRGLIVIVIDDENRENEGDFICSAEHATAENVNMMAKYARGLICMPMSENLCKKMSLEQMVNDNTDNHSTAFTVSIDHIDTSTGISAYDRSLTARMIVDKNASAADFRRPGHMFPLCAKEGGVLRRNGHTEATVDLMKLAGLSECGLCCEIMADDGSMMRTDEIMRLAEDLDLKVITIADLVKYRMKHENIMEEVSVVNLPTKYGEYRMHGYVNKIDGTHHVALTMGDISDGDNVMCRVHSECLTGDVFGSARCDCGEQLELSLMQVAREGKGVIIYLRQEGRGIGLINKLKAYELQEKGYDTVEANEMLGFMADQREYASAANILKNLSVSKVRLITNNPDKIKELTEYGIDVTDRIVLPIKPHRYDVFYLKTKQTKMKHLTNY